MAGARFRAHIVPPTRKLFKDFRFLLLLKHILVGCLLLYNYPAKRLHLFE